MPTNLNTYNSRLTSEALEQKFRDTFPSQAGAELVNDLYAQGVIVPVVDFSDVAAGQVLPTELQQAWDHATSRTIVNASTQTLTSTPGFYRVQISCVVVGSTAQSARVQIDDGISAKDIMRYYGNLSGATAGAVNAFQDPNMVVFLRSGDSLKIVSDGTAITMVAAWRQIADVNGNVVNPLGFSF